VVRATPTKSDQLGRANRQSLMTFLAFLEERGHIKAAKWWTDAILDPEDGVPREFVDSRFKRNPKLAPLPVPGMIVDHDGASMLRIGSTSVVLPSDLLARIGHRYPADGAAAAITPERIYVGEYDTCMGFFKLACIDRSEGRIRWIADAEGDGWCGNFSGNAYHYLEIVEQRDRVVVFSLGPMGDSAEAFRADDGVNLFRFSSRYSSR
jgi:hypothetical protein